MCQTQALSNQVYLNCVLIFWTVVTWNIFYHDDVIKWKHFPRYLPFVKGIHQSQRPVTQCFEVFFDLRLNKLLSKQLRRQCFETPSRSLWRHCNVLLGYDAATCELCYIISESYMMSQLCMINYATVSTPWIRIIASDNARNERI